MLNVHLVKLASYPVFLSHIVSANCPDCVNILFAGLNYGFCCQPQRIFVKIFTTHHFCYSFSALARLIWQQEGHLPCKKLGVALLVVTI